ncbi:nitroreductase family protein [Candidatus Bathyarchaeota archaeon]|nr:nitroreductase family protein [Candidatus Bathyarchaeota archaeon]
MIYESLINRRTIRKFTQQPVTREVLKKCVDAARLSPSGANRQPLKFIACNDKKYVSQIFSSLPRWTSIPGYKHAPNEVPTAYIIILLDTKLKEKQGSDAGIAAMSILMVAYENSLGSCILGVVDMPRLKEILRIPSHLQILLVVALGYPSEKPKAVEIKENDTTHWIDEKGVLNVPKRKLEDVLVWNTY